MRIRRVSVSLLGLLVLTLAACGGSGDDSDSSGSSSTTAPDETAAPPTVLVLGDSLGQNIAEGLERDGRVDVINSAGVNCTIAGGTLQGYEGNVIGSGCENWRDEWAAEVAETNPDVVLLNTGGWEVVDRWFVEPIGVGFPATILEDDFGQRFVAALDEAAGILTAGGAKLVVLNTPYFDPDHAFPEQGDITNIWWEAYGPIDPPAGYVSPAPGQTFVPAKDKVDRINALKQQWVDGGGAGVIADLQSVASPNGEYTDELDGVVVRDDDRIHFNAAGQDVVAAWLVPQLIAAAQS